MKVAVTDYTFDSLEVEKRILEPLGCQVAAVQCKTPDELIGLTADADAVISQFAPLTPAVIEEMQKVRVIVRYGIGVDNVDLAAARAKGIPVCNVPDYCINEVADHTLALLLTATRQTATHDAIVKSGQWKLSVPDAALKTLAEMTVGVVGFGRIGRQVVRRLQAFGCEVSVFDPVVEPSEIEGAGCRTASLDELLSNSDIVTLHCPSNDKTRRMINAQSLAQMKPGVVFVNVSRGDLVETAALVEALKSGQVSVAALDVCETEPLPADSPLLSLDNVFFTPHIASVSAKSMRTLRESVANTVACAIRGEALPNVVNGVGVAAK